MSINIPMNELLKVVDNRDSNNPTELNGFEAEGAIWRKPCAVTFPTKPTGVDLISCLRKSTESNCQTYTTIVLNEGIVLYGDEITINASAATGYNNPSITNISGVDITDPDVDPHTGKVTGSVSFKVTAGLIKTFSVSYIAKPAGVASFKIYAQEPGLSSSVYINNPTEPGSFSVPYGTKVYAVATAATGYNTPTVTGISTSSSSPTTITGNIAAYVTAGTLKAYTLTISTIEGVATQTVKRGSTTLSNGATIYHGDVLTVTATAEEKYGLPTVTSPIEVTGNIDTANYITAGEYKKYTVTIVSSNTTYGTVDTSTITVGHGTILRSNKTSGSGSEIQVVGLTSIWIPATASWVILPDLSIIATASPVESAAINGNFDGWLIDGSPDTNYPKFDITVKDNMTITARFSGVAQTYSIPYPAMPTGVSAFKIYKNGSVVVTNPTSASSFTATYGDKIYATATAATGYNNPTITGVGSTSAAATEINGNNTSINVSTGVATTTVSVGVTAGSIKRFNITYPAMPTGVDSFVIFVGGRPSITNPTSAGTLTVDYGTSVYASAMAATGYNSPTVSGISTNISSPTTITEAKTVTVTAGSVITISAPVITYTGQYDEDVYYCTIKNNNSVGVSFAGTLKATPTSITISATNSSGGNAITVAANSSVDVYFRNCGDWDGAQIDCYFTAGPATSSTTTWRGDCSITIVNSGYGTVKNGSTTIASGNKVPYGTTLTISTTAATGYTTTVSSSTGTVSGSTGGTFTVDGPETITFTRTGNTYYVYYKQGLATSGTLPSTQSRVYPNATTLSTNNMAKSNTTANSYTVTYDQGIATSGTLPSTQTSVNTTTYTKNGWTTSSTAYNDRDYANGASYSSAADLTLYPNFTTSTTNGGVTLGANTMAKSNTTANSYTVTYHQGNASSTTNLPTAQTSVNTTKFTANGWAKTRLAVAPDYANNGGTGALTENLTLYPYFTSSTSNGGVTLSSNTMSRDSSSEFGYKVTYAKGTASSTANLPSAQTAIDTRSYTHEGWATTASGSKAYNKGAATGALSANVNLYPYFSSSLTRGSVTLATNNMSKSNEIVANYVVTFDPNGGRWPLDTSGTGGNVAYPDGGDGSGITNPLASTTVTTSKVRSYAANGWTTTSGSATRTYTNGQSVQLTDNTTVYPCFSYTDSTAAVSLPSSISRTGYTLAGWALSADAAITLPGTSYTPAGNITLYAIWEPNTYWVYYKQGLATSGTLPSDQSRVYPNAVTLATNNMTKSSTTDATYTVTFNYNGSGTANTTATATKTRSYTANGWTTTEKSTTRNYANGTSFGLNSTTNLTLYPCFTQSTSTSAVTLPTPTRTGFTFQGWSTSSTAASGTTGSYTPTGNVTLYAVWKRNDITATFTNPTYGTWGSSSLTLPYGTTWSISGRTITFTKPDNGGTVTNTVTATLPTARTLSFGTASYGSWNSTDAVSVFDYSYSTPVIAGNATGTITAAQTFSASNSRSNVTFTNSLGGTSGTNSTYSGNHTWTISGTNTSGTAFTRTFTSTNHGAQYYYVISRSSTATQATSNITFTPTVSRTTHSYTISYNAMPVGVASLTIYRDGSAVVTNPTSSGSFSANYGSKVYAAATAATGYIETIVIKGVGTSPSTETSVTRNISITVVAPVLKTFTVTIARNSTSYGTVSQSSVTNVPYGTAISTSGNKLTIGSTTVTATPNNSSAQYTYSFSSWSNASGTVTANKTITANFARSTRSYTISYPAMPTGVSSFVIYKAGSAQVTNPTSAGSFTAAYNTQVYATATAATGYEAPTISGIRTDSSLPTSVTGNITVSLTAGAKIVESKWQTIFSGSQKITMPRTQTGEAGATFNFNPYPADGTQVRITCSWTSGPSQEYTRAATYDEYGNYSFTPISYTDPLSLDGAIAAQLTGLDSTHLYYTKFSQLPVTLTVTKIEIYAPEPASPDIYPGIYGEQTITLPYGDELLIRVNSAYEVEYSTDLYTETLWGDATDGIIHWGSAISMDYVTSTTPIHFYEFDIYNEQGYLQVVGDGNLEADYIKEYGRYMGSVWIENNNDWAVSLVDQG